MGRQQGGSSPKPLIGIPAALERARWTVWDREAYLLARSYVTAVQAAGGLAVLIPPDESTLLELELVLNKLDGVMLAGGSDIDPSLYGASRHDATDHNRPERDQFELALTQRVIDREIPFLGICRGMQVLNVARGGTLIQHLPDDVGHINHRRTLGSFAKADHDVRLEAGSLAARAAGAVVHATKSHHHQGVDKLGDGLVATGWCALDGLVEAIEMPNRRFVLGVQWHPEVDSASNVIAALVRAAATPAVKAGAVEELELDSK